MPTVRQPLAGVASAESLRVGSVTDALSTGDIAAGSDVSSLFFDASAGEYAIRRANGAKLTFGSFTELLTIAVAASTDTASTIPAEASVFGASVRVVTSIPGTSTFSVSNPTAGVVYSTAPVSSTAGSTDPGDDNCPHGPVSASGMAIRITPDVTPSAGTGQVRVVAYWYVPTPPTS